MRKKKNKRKLYFLRHGEYGIEYMAFPSYAISGRFLHNSLLGISRECLQVACDIVERTPQGSFYVSALCSLMEIFTS